MSEFAVFSDAYTAWYGKEASEKQIEKVFVQYLLENKVPFWVRNYARSRVQEEYGLTSQADKDSRKYFNYYQAPRRTIFPAAVVPGMRVEGMEVKQGVVLLHPA